MKQLTAILLCLVLTISLTGCLGTGEVDTPATAADGTAWDDSWQNIGGFLGLEAPVGDFEFFDSNGNLPNMELYYATWVLGDPIPIDDDTSAYDAQLYFLLQPTASAAEADALLNEWRGNIDSSFTVTGEQTVTAAGQEFTLVSYTGHSHYGIGVTALGRWEDKAILVDIAHIEGNGLDPEGILLLFLNGFHYA